MPKVCLLAILRPWRVTADQKPARGVCACEGRLLLTSGGGCMPNGQEHRAILGFGEESDLLRMASVLS